VGLRYGLGSSRLRHEDGGSPSSDSQEILRQLAKRYGVNPKTVAKWKKRASATDLPTGPKNATPTVLSIEEEAIVVGFRRHTLRPLDDCLRAAADNPASDAILAAGVRATPRHLSAAGGGHVERMNRTIKEATVKRFHYETRDHLRSHLTDFVQATPSPRGSRPSMASRPTSSSARSGQQSQTDSPSIRSSKCRN
jgi:hypothetical protein